MATEDRAQHSSVPFTPVETDVSASNRYLTTILDCMRKDAAERDRQWREDARTRDRQLEALLTRFADGQDTANINASMLQQISKQERKEREEKERKRAIPNPQSMKTEDDIADFIEAFETVHIAKDTPKEAWGVHLLPLLNDQAKAAVSGLPADDKLDYNTLKTNLLASVVETTKHASKTFWELHKKSGHTYRTFVLELKRLSKRFAFAETYEEVSDKFVLEKFLQDLAPEQQAYVREREPKTALEAADTAANYLSIHGLDQTKADYSKPWTLRPNYTKDNSSAPKKKWQDKPWWKEKPYRTDNHNTKTPTDVDQHTDQPHDKPPTADTTASREPERKKPRCFKCGKLGHIASQCRRVNRVSVPSMADPSLKQLIVSGKIGEQAVDDILFDSGADISVISSDLLPAKYQQCYPVVVGGVGGQAHTYDTALLDAEIHGQSLKLFAAVAPPEHLSHRVIVGRNLPGKIVKWTVEIEDQSEKESEVEQEKIPTPERKPTPTDSTTLTDKYNDTTPDKTVDGDSEHTLPKKKSRRKHKFKPTPLEPVGPTQAEEPMPLEGTPPLQEASEPMLTKLEKEEETTQKVQQVNAVQTRAAKKKEEKELAEDQKATDGSGVQLTDLAALPPPPRVEDKTEDDDPADPEAIPITKEELIKCQGSDDSLRHLFQDAEGDSSPYTIKEEILYRGDTSGTSLDKDLVVIPEGLRKRVLAAAHDRSGHVGSKKMSRMLQQHFYWPGMGRDAKEWTKKCPTCLTWNGKKTHRAPLQPLPVVTTPWEKVALDIVGPLPRTRRGHRYLLTLMDFGTRFLEAIPLKKIDAETTCGALMEIFARFGVPEEILTDNGSNFTAGLTEELLRRLKCHHVRSSPYHPQSNGMLERVHHVLKGTLEKLRQGDPQWDIWLPDVLMALRTVPHSATGFSPFELLFGREARTPLKALRETMSQPSKTPVSVLKYLSELTKKMEITQEIVKERDKQAKEQSKVYYDRKAREDSLSVGESVLCMSPTGTEGLTAKWEGPYKVMEKKGDLTYLISAPCRGKRGRTVHRNLLKRHILQINTATVITAAADSEHLDSLTLGPSIGAEKEEEGDRWVKATAVDRLSEEQRRQLGDILRSFDKTFSDTPGKADVAPFTIPTGSSAPIAQYPYRIPHKWREKAREEIQQLLKNGIIQPSSSPWTSPVVCVPKPGGNVRLCVDYRKVNAVTTPDIYPLPRIEELLEAISSSHYISTLDLSKGYYQIPMAEEDIAKTAFATTEGKYEFVRLPFGLKNAPAAFQRAMDSLFAQEKCTYAYIDDVVVFNRTWNSHLQHLRRTILTLREKGFTIKLSKCHFAQDSVEFLGHRVGSGKIGPQETKVAAIRDFQQPKTKKNLRAFLGLIGYYRRFIPNFAGRSATLTDLTKKNQPDRLNWTTDHQRTFQELKQAMVDAPVLLPPDPSVPYVLTTDASGRGIGSVLSQQQEGVEHPVAYYSRKLLPREERYGITELEALAIVDSVKHFSPYLLGGHFTVVTDHRALTFLETMKGGGPRLTRWALALQPFSFDVRFRPGNTNANADGLSRQDWPEEQQQRQTLLEIAPASLTEKGGGVGTTPQLLQPTDSKADIARANRGRDYIKEIKETSDNKVKT